MAHKLFCAVLLVFGLSVQAAAYEYIASISFGQAKVSDLGAVSVLIPSSPDESDTALGVQFAVFFREDVAVSLAFNDFGSFPVNTGSGGGMDKLEISNKVFFVSPSVPLENGLRVYANLGINWWDVSQSGQSVTGTDLAFGGGLSYEVTDTFVAGIEANRYAIKESNITQLAVSLGYRF